MSKWDARFLRVAVEVASWSKDPSTQVGAVITTSEGEIISTGYNGICRGVDDKIEARSERPIKYSWYEHAERNAIFNCAKRGIGTNGCTIYVTSTPKKFPCCADCARAIIQSGIKRVVQITLDETPPQWKDSCDVSTQMFKEAGVFVFTLDING